MVPCLKHGEDVTEKMYCFPCRDRGSILLFRIAGMGRKGRMSYLLKDFSSSTLLAVILCFEAANIFYAILWVKGTSVTHRHVISS